MHSEFRHKSQLIDGIGQIIHGMEELLRRYGLGRRSAYRLDQFIQERLSLCCDSFGKLPIADFLGIAVQFFESVVYVNHQAEFLGTQTGYKIIIIHKDY